MTSEQILLKIDGLEEQVEGLRKEYYSITPPCANKECVYYREIFDKQGKCAWTNEITRCKDYIPAKEE